MRGLKLVLLVLAVFVVSACWFALQQVAGYTLPLPWPDEVVFFFSAKNFAEYQSLLTPELNPNRQLMWFPPGFAIITGLLLKFTDASYGAARLLSALFMAQSFLLLFLASRKFSSKSVAWLLLLGGFFSMHVIIAGNLVRPEALVLFLLSWAFYLNVNNKGVAAISIASLAILVHPVSSLAVIPIFIISLDRLKGCRRQSNWWQWILLGVAICSFQCYAVELSANWSAVVHDYNHQLNSRNFSLLNDFLMEP
ncbi:MAG: ArnT family glycosyltransferase, partial [Flexibacteraceae bacterium]